MKQKTIRKKLQLNKTTVANMDIMGMKQVLAGELDTGEPGSQCCETDWTCPLPPTYTCACNTQDCEPAPTAPYPEY
jgi:hypothetical protein